MIDALTHDRLRDESPVRESVQRAMVELIDMHSRQAQAEAAASTGVQSENNDGVSRSYADAGSMTSYWNGRQRSAIFNYFAGETDARGIPLLYAGVEFDGGGRA